MRLALALVLLATPLAAQPMSADDFKRHVTGRTLAFTGPDGELFGVERYLPGRRVIWSAEPGVCLEGRWTQIGSEICFIYDGDPLPKCWSVTATQSGLQAVSPSTGTILFEAQDTQPLICAGPDLLS